MPLVFHAFFPSVDTHARQGRRAEQGTQSATSQQSDDPDNLKDDRDGLKDVEGDLELASII